MWWIWKPPYAIVLRSEPRLHSVGDLLAQLLPVIFDPRLGVHTIHALSAKSGNTIHAVSIEADLRAVFFVEGDTVFSVDIGTHAIYRT